ncbi:MAG: PKD domain-containing protein [Bacteroidia bacterium]
MVIRSTNAKILVVILLMIIPGGITRATHFMGVDITYECLDPCTYRIFHKSYFDCSGGATTLPPGQTQQPAISFIGNPGGCQTVPQIIGNWIFVHNIEVTPVCPSWVSQTACNGGALLNGVAEGYWYADYNFCTAGFPACSTFNITWSNCCRNGAITSGASNAGIFTGNTIIDPSLLPCNNSPTFINPPVPYICSGQAFTFNQGAYDPDGDSLSYSLITCYDGPGASVVYNFGYTPQQPLGATWNVQVNAATGDISMTPNPTGLPVVGVLCLEVKEWRNGIQIGSVVRDIQITVISFGCVGSNPTTGGITNASINSLTAFPTAFNEINTCVGLPLCFQIPTTNPDPTLTYTMSWDQSIAGATFINAGNPLQANSFSGGQPVADFCWTPNATGLYSFVLTLQDNKCPINGLNQYSIIIKVNNGLENSAAQADTVGCNEVDLYALPDPNAGGNLLYSWLGTGGLASNPNSNDSAFTHFYPGPGTYPYQVTIKDTFGCAVTINNSVTITQGAIIDGGPDVVMCSGYTAQLGSQAIPGQTYLWTPAIGLNNNTSSNPTFTFVNNGTTPDTLNFLAEADNGICTTFDNVRVVVFPTPSVSISPAAPQICNGDTMTLTATGGSTYQWSTGETTASIQVAPNNTTSYSVVTFANGCTSSPVYTTVEVTDKPVGQLSGDLLVCPGDNTVLTASGGTSYLWNISGSTTSSITVNNIQAATPVSVSPVKAGCVGDPVSVVIQTHPKPVADFVPSNECEGEITTFTDLSSVASGAIVLWNWNFQDPSTGNANFSNLNQPIHTFSDAGTYQVQMIATSSDGCKDTVVRPVNVAPAPDVNFNFTNVCEGLPNQFTSTSTISLGGTIVNQEWDFGDNSAKVQGSSAAHVFPDYGYYNVTLTATSENGCSKSFTKTVFVHPNPIADFRVVNACQDSVVFASTSSTVPGVLDYIQSYSWNFGDPNNPPNTSNLGNPSHVYPNAGVFQISLTVTTENGCIGNVIRDVDVYSKPAADFVYDGTCEKETTYFLDRTGNTGINPTPIDNWSWDFGDGATSSFQNPHHDYSDAGPGVYRVMLAVGTFGSCVDTVYRDITINPKPVMDYKAQPVCLGDSMVFVNEASIASGTMTYTWDFGDQSATSSLPNPVHTYREAGTYQIYVVATSDSGCVTPKIGLVTVNSIPEIFEARNDTVCFSNLASLQAITDPQNEVLWFYGLNDNTPFHKGFSYTTPPLPYDITYYIQPVSEFGCINDRVPVTGFVFSPQSAQIVKDPAVIEMPLANINFDVATSASLTSWLWNFGDGNTSFDPSPAHEYQYPGKYEVSVVLTDINGCEITLVDVVEVKKIVNISVPSAFSPNGDGINDIFRVGHYNLSQFSIQIFNRWGQMVFESNNPDFEWNGNSLSGQRVQEGVYVYSLQATDFDGNSISENRTITVIK